MSFRSGHEHARHIYPERRPAGVPAPPTARNFAGGPASDTPISAGGGTQIPWDVIASGAPSGVDVPITPQSSGVILIVGVVTVENTSDAPVDVTVKAQVNGSTITIPATDTFTVDGDDGSKAIRIVAEVTGLSVGVLVNVHLLVIAGSSDAITLSAGSSTVDVQEVPVSTG